LFFPVNLPGNLNQKCLIKYVYYNVNISISSFHFEKNFNIFSIYLLNFPHSFVTDKDIVPLENYGINIYVCITDMTHEQG